MHVDRFRAEHALRKRTRWQGGRKKEGSAGTSEGIKESKMVMERKGRGGGGGGGGERR